MKPVGVTIPMDYETYFGSGNFANTGMPYLGRVLLVAKLSDLDVLKTPAKFLDLVHVTASASSQISSNAFPPPDVPAPIVQRVLDFFAGVASSVFAEDTAVEEYVAQYQRAFAVCPPLTVGDHVCSQSTTTHAVFLSEGAAMIQFEATLLFGGVRKFVDSLAVPGSQNSLGCTIPVAVPDVNAYPGSDYYEIAMVEFEHKFHTDLPPTTCRGYVQLNAPGDGMGDGFVGNMGNMGNRKKAPKLAPQYAGPLIEAHGDRPVRIKFVNLLPTNEAGLLKIPCDTTVMGCGLGPDGVSAYTQNRALLHLHGGVTPWISDGSPHQWVVPDGDRTPLKVGALHSNVPDMPDPGPGATTYYYTNQQSGRLMFFHDHTFGITRLNFYVGAAAFYRLHDEAEADLISRGVLPAQAIPLMIQDKTFVPPRDQLDHQDPTWNVGRALGLPWGTEGAFWYPHVYVTNQNPNDPSATMGANDRGRWDYGPWFWPPFTTLLNQPAVDEMDPAKRKIPAIPNPSIVPEAFCDTMTVNGTAFPYFDVARKTYRFQIVNGSSDRTMNLQLHRAASNSTGSVLLEDGTVGELHTGSGEVAMVPAVPGLPAKWPTDGREGGVPDPAHTGPKFVQIANEGGLLPKVVEHANNPVGYEYNRRNIVVLSVSTANLLLAPAERADVLVDFSNCEPGDLVILYNDAPAAMPGFDPRLDYYTGSPDLTSSGGAPPILPGFGPNTRTVMQFRVTDGPAEHPLNVPLLDAEISRAYVQSQDPPIVPQSDYKMFAGQALDESLFEDNLVCIQDNTIQFQTANLSASAVGYLNDRGEVANFLLTDPGANYSPLHTVLAVDPAPEGGQTAVAICDFWDGEVSSVKVAEGGSGYHLIEVLLVGTHDGGVPVEVSTTATLQLARDLDIPYGSVLAVNLPEPNRTRFDRPPTVRFPAVGPTKASAEATLLNGLVVDIAVTQAGPSYLPQLQFTEGFGCEGSAVLTVSKGSVSKVEIKHPGYGYWSAPTVTVEPAPQGRPAKLRASVTSRGQLESIVVVHPGSGYSEEAVVKISGDHPHNRAQGTLSVSGGYVSGVRVEDGGSGFVHEPAVVVGDVPGVTVPASFAARVAHGRVVEVEVLEPGAGYTAPPSLTIAGARAVATVVALGALDGCKVTNPGSQYSCAPVVSVWGVSAGRGATFAVKVHPKHTVREVFVKDPGSGYQRPPAVRIIDPVGFTQVRPLEPKAFVENFTLDYGRMSALFGVELPFTNVANQTSLPFGYADPPTERWSAPTELKAAPTLGDGTAFWKITHNGVDTHVIHLHLVNVQVINRVGWDGMLSKPDANELGWKDSVRMNPLQDTIIAMRPTLPGLPFGVLDSVRPYDVTKPLGYQSPITFINLDPLTGEARTTVNKLHNYGWEYTWHCHVLGHEENDFMRPIEMRVPAVLPPALALGSVVQRSSTAVQLSWSNPAPVVERLKYNRAGIVSVQVWRRDGEGAFAQIAALPSNASSFVDDQQVSQTPFGVGQTSYKIAAVNAAGGSDSQTVTIDIE